MRICISFLLLSALPAFARVRTTRSPVPKVAIVPSDDSPHVPRQNTDGRQTLTIGTTTPFPATTSDMTPPLYTLPSAKVLTISIALCGGDEGTSLPRFFVTNDSSIATPSSEDIGSTTTDEDTVFEITLTQGVGSWAGKFPDGGVLAVESNGVTNIARTTPFEIGVSGDVIDSLKPGSGPLHQNLDPLVPELGDSSSTQALLFSYPVYTPDTKEPKYPNYTLPATGPQWPSMPAQGTEYIEPQLVLVETSKSNITSIFQNSCRLRKVKSIGTISDSRLWLRDEDGWRQQWMVEGLTATTNYTMYTIANGFITGPSYFVTKSESFTCPLVHSLSYCPSTTYASPLPAPKTPFTSYNYTNLPTDISTPLLSNIANMTTNLLTMGCGRDQYSLLVTCGMCQREYRRWLCAVAFPRCGEPRPGDTMSILPAPTTVVGQRARQTTDPNTEAQVVLSALVAEPTPASSSALGTDAWDVQPYAQLQPCLERCTAADRACPYFLGFVCPYVDFNAAASYGVGYVDSGARDGGEGDGLVGSGKGRGVGGNGGPQGQDRWGNVWCNWG